MFSDFVGGADIWMVEGRGGASFALKALEAHGIIGKFVRQEFQSDEAAEFEILGLVHHTHAAGSELLDDPVVRDDLVKQSRGPPTLSAES